MHENTTLRLLIPRPTRPHRLNSRAGSRLHPIPAQTAISQRPCIRPRSRSQTKSFTTPRRGFLTPPQAHIPLTTTHMRRRRWMHTHDRCPTRPPYIQMRSTPSFNPPHIRLDVHSNTPSPRRQSENKNTTCPIIDAKTAMPHSPLLPPPPALVRIPCIRQRACRLQYPQQPPRPPSLSSNRTTTNPSARNSVAAVAK
jgi:hypothetical protein